MNCQKAQILLSEYIDNALSARDTWELDKHLAECHACTRLLNEMRRTVEALAAAPRFEVSTEFIEKLHTRIAGLEPEPPRRAWLLNLRILFRPRVLPAWGAAAALCALMVVLWMPHRPSPSDEELGSVDPTLAQVQTARNQNVALSASNPLEDLAAAHLAAHNSNETSVDSGMTQ